MDVLITLPKALIEKILSGEKTIEMRKRFPTELRPGQDGFFVVEKGTINVHCYCKVGRVLETAMAPEIAREYKDRVCVDEDYFLKYAPCGTYVYFWFISRVRPLIDITTYDLEIVRNPQSYTYVYSPLHVELFSQIYCDPDSIC